MSAYGGGVFDAVILAGGRAERLGGVDKPGLEVGGTPMIRNVVAAVRGARRVVVVGPPRDIPDVVFAREDPPGAGPIPALRAGLPHVTAPRVALLAGDLPFLAPAHVTTLLRAAQDTADGLSGSSRTPGSSEPDMAVDGVSAGVIAVDGEGRDQWLLGVWDTTALRAALDAYGGRSLRGLLGPLVGRRVALPRQAWFDCDTEDDLREARGERAG